MADASKPSFFSGLRSRTKPQKKLQKQSKSSISSSSDTNSIISNDSLNSMINLKSVHRTINPSRKRHSVFLPTTPISPIRHHSVTKSKSSSSLIDISFDSIDSDTILNKDESMSNLDDTQSHLNHVFSDYNSKLFSLTEADPSSYSCSSSTSSSSSSSDHMKPQHPLRKLLIHSPNASHHSLVVKQQQQQRQPQEPILTLNLYKPKLEDPQTTTISNTVFFGSKFIQSNYIFNDSTDDESPLSQKKLLTSNFNLVDPIFTPLKYNHLHSNHRTSLYFV